MYNDLTGSKLRRALLQQDHISMTYSIESRFPWLNNELVDFCFGLPNNFLLKNTICKFILRDTIKEKLMQLPKRAAQSPQTKWMKEFILQNLIRNLNNDTLSSDYPSELEGTTELEGFGGPSPSSSVVPYSVVPTLGISLPAGRR